MEQAACYLVGFIVVSATIVFWAANGIFGLRKKNIREEYPWYKGKK